MKIQYFNIIRNKSVQVSKPKAEAKNKSNFAKSQEKIKKQKVQQVQQRNEKDYISDKTQLEKTLKIQELIGKYATLKGKSELSEQDEKLQIEFLRKIVQYPNFIFMNMLEAGSSMDPSILGNVNIFSSKLKYDQYLERFESKLLKKEYASVKVSSAPNIAQILAATSSTSSIDVLTATIDDTIKLSPPELREIMDWTSIVWSELLYSVLIKSIKEQNQTAGELKDLDIQLQNVSHDLKQNKGSYLAMQNKYQKLIDEKVKLLQSQESKSEGYKSRLYLTEKIYVAQRDNESLSEVDKFAVPSRKDPSKKIVHIYSAPDVAALEIHNFMKTAKDNSVSIAVVSGSELFEFLVRNKIDLLKISFLGNYDDLITHKLNLEEIEEIAEIGRREAQKRQTDNENNQQEEKEPKQE